MKDLQQKLVGLLYANVVNVKFNANYLHDLFTSNANKNIIKCVNKVQKHGNTQKKNFISEVPLSFHYFPICIWAQYPKFPIVCKI